MKNISFLVTFWQNKIPDWLKTLFIFYIIYFSIKYFYPDFLGGKLSLFFIRGLIASYPYYAKLIFIIGIFINICILIRYILTIYFFILFSKKKTDMPIYLPKTTLDWLNYIKNASSRVEKGTFIEHYTRIVLIYIAMILFFSFVAYML